MIETETDADGVAVVTLDMPGRSTNVIDWVLIAALDVQIAALAANPDVIGIVVTSGKSSFVEGIDPSIINAFAEARTTAKACAEDIGRIGAVFRKLETCGKPVVAAATGTTLGGGLELMLAAHYRIAADEEGAQFGLPQITVGLLPGAGGTQRLPRLIGIEPALELLLHGRTLAPADALEAGLLHEVVPRADLVAAAKRAIRNGRATSVAPWDAKGFRIPGAAPASARVLNLFTLMNARVQVATQNRLPAAKAILSCVFEGTRLPIDKALKIERQYFGQLASNLRSPDRDAGPPSQTRQ